MDQLAPCHLPNDNLTRLAGFNHLDVHELRAVLLGNAESEERLFKREWLRENVIILERVASRSTSGRHAHHRVSVVAPLEQQRCHDKW